MDLQGKILRRVMVSGTKGVAKPFDAEVSAGREALQLHAMSLTNHVISILDHVLASGGTLSQTSTSLTRLIAGES